MGTAAIACPSLKALVGWAGAEVVGVVTQPDRPAGRHLRPQPSPVKQLAGVCGLPVLQPEKVREAGFLEALRAWGPELIVVMAYGQILPASVLDLPRYGCVNVHASLLPKYRGAAPIQWALVRGETETGVTIMLMDEGMDTGPILSQRRIRIDPDDTAGTLHDRLAVLGAELLLETLPGYVAGRIVPRPQPLEGISYAPRLRKADGLLDWTLSARELWLWIRAFDPWPGAFTWWWRQDPLAGGQASVATLGGGVAARQARPVLLKVWRAAVEPRTGPAGEILEVDARGVVVGCGQEALRLLEVQAEGGRRMGIAEFLSGHPMRRGDRLGGPAEGTSVTI
jgi:methionyl-tRNA formyltransferase